MGMHSAVLAHFLLDEKLQRMGMLGCLLCIVGSTIIVLHAPQERSLDSVEEIWDLATQPGWHVIFFTLFSACKHCRHHFPPFLLSPKLSLLIPVAFLLYTASVVAVALVLIFYCAPRYGQTNILVYIGICSSIGSLTVRYKGFAFGCS